MREAFGDLHIPNGDHSGDDVDHGEGDGSPAVSGTMTGVIVGNDAESMVGQPGSPDLGMGGGGGGAHTDPQAGTDVDPLEENDMARATGPEDDPMDQGSSVEAEWRSNGDDAEDGEDGEIASLFDHRAIELAHAEPFDSVDFELFEARANEAEEQAQDDAAVHAVIDLSLSPIDYEVPHHADLSLA